MLLLATFGGDRPPTSNFTGFGLVGARRRRMLFGSEVKVVDGWGRNVSERGRRLELFEQAFGQRARFGRSGK